MTPVNGATLPSTIIPRRSALVAMAACAYASIHGESVFVVPALQSPRPEANAELVIGRWYLATHVADLSEVAKLKPLARRLRLGDVHARSALSLMIEKDLKEGKVMFLGGWQVAISELRLCAASVKVLET